MRHRAYGMLAVGALVAAGAATSGGQAADVASCPPPMATVFPSFGTFARLRVARDDRPRCRVQHRWYRPYGYYRPYDPETSSRETDVIR